MLLPDSTDCVPENHEQMKLRELDPNQSSQTAQSLATPDVNTAHLHMVMKETIQKWNKG